MEGFFQRVILLYRPLISKLNELLAEYDISYSLWQVIFYLKAHGTSSLADIAKHYNIEKPSITRRVFSLEEKKIVRVISGSDRREKIIQLTEYGDELYKKCRKKITELEYDIMKNIPEDEQAIIFEILPKIRENIINEKEK